MTALAAVPQPGDHHATTVRRVTLQVVERHRRPPNVELPDAEEDAPPLPARGATSNELAPRLGADPE